jgi:hypothetical protein
MHRCWIRLFRTSLCAYRAAMAKLVVHGATLKCSEGASPSTLSILPVNPALADEQRAATIMDFTPMSNVAPFGMCKTQANPQVAAATAAAQGVLTPQPCVPVITGPWSPGSPCVQIEHQKALTDDSTCRCAWTGTIEIADPGTDVKVD